jgi:DNA repair ATPase RecN
LTETESICKKHLLTIENLSALNNQLKASQSAMKTQSFSIAELENANAELATLKQLMQ